MQLYLAPDTPFLDFGCGTGLSGLALRAAGFETIHGVDISNAMIEKARAKNAYQTLAVLESGAMPAETYRGICAIGVIGAGAAPIETFDLIWTGLETGGYFVFSFNDHALEDPAFEAKVAWYTKSDKATVVLREYGDQLPGLNLNSVVYVLEKM